LVVQEEPSAGGKAWAFDSMKLTALCALGMVLV